MDLPSEPDYADFRNAYVTFAPTIYGIALRIAKDKSLAEVILTDIFLCFNNRGLLGGGRQLSPSTIFEVTFHCTANVLAGHLSEQEIRESIKAERSHIISKVRLPGSHR